MLATLKWSAKSIWALLAPIAIVIINDNAEWIANQTAGIVAGLLTGLAVWLQPNGPSPS